MSGEIPIQARIWDKRLIRNLMESSNKWINLCLKTWLNNINKSGLLEEIKILRWCSHDPDFIPNKLDVSYKGWANRGLSSYCTFFNQGAVSSFEALKRLHGLNNSDFFRFLQVRHHINSSIPESQKVFENDLLNFFISAYRADSGLISRLYKGLQGVKTTGITYI